MTEIHTRGEEARRRERRRAREKRGEEPQSIHRCHSDAPVSACVSARRGERELREENKSWELESSPGFISLSFFISIIQGMKAGVSWHGRIKGRDALNAASLSTREKEEEGGDNTQQGQQDF